MAQAGYTPISLYYSTTAAAAPTAGNLVPGELAINITDGKLYYEDNLGAVQAVAILSRTNGIFSDLTGSITVAKGTTGQQPGSPVTGMLRYNTTTNQFEGYSGSSPSWLPVGGSTISNDTSTSTNVYPIFANATSGTATTVYTSNAKYLYKPSTGDLQASQLIASNGIVLNATTLVTSYTIPAGYSAESVGGSSGFTIPSGLTVTVSSGSRWVVL
jgi:hypothetical protein